MAEAPCEKDTIKCSICLQFYTQPRKLSHCGHVFCENCILTYVSSLEENVVQNWRIPCPFCKASIHGPAERNTLQEWVKSLKLDEELISKVKLHAERQVDETENCSPCKAQGKRNKVSKYCANCHETMCEACSDVHNALKLMKHHKVLDVLKTDPIKGREIEMAKTLAEYLTCPIHPDRLNEFHCQDDDVLICATCVAADHRKCISVVEINGNIASETVKKDANKLKDELLALSTYAEDTIKAKRADNNKLKDQCESISANVGEIRVKLALLLEALEENVNQQTKAITKECTLARDEQIEKVNYVISSLTKLHNLIENAVSDSPFNQLYVIVRMVRKALLTHEGTIVTVGEQCKSLEIRLEQQSILEGLLALNINEPETLAKVEKTETAVVLPQYKEINIARFGTVKNAIKYHIEGNYSGGNDPVFSDILFLQNDTLIIDRYKKYCIMVNKNHELVKCKSLVSGLSRATYMKTGLVALCGEKTKKICFISADKTMNVKSEIVPKYTATALYGLSDGTLAVAWTNPCAFGIILPYGNSGIENIYFTKDNAGRELKSFEYMAVDSKRGHVIQPCTESKAVYCFDLEGNPQFSYANDNLKKPRGVAVDKFGNIFICDSESSSIHVITSSGSAIQIIKEGCPKRPLAISFNSDFDQFAVTNEAKDWCEVAFFTQSHEL